jgi:RNase H-fold protein (predicted Holliday junction resolvase)
MEQLDLIELCQKIRRKARGVGSPRLDIPDIKFLFQDERLSSVAANKLLSEAGINFGINLSMRQKQ